MTFPSILTSYTQTTPTARLNSPSHSGLHNTVSSALGQVETVVGVDGDNSVLGTIIGDLRSPGSNGGGHVQTANKGGTGQTVFTKGDILIAQSSSVLSKLSVGLTNGYALIVDNTQPLQIKWGIPGGNPTIRAYSTASTLTWSKPSTLSYISVELVGSGGGGGGSGSGGGGSAGGSAGGYSKKIIPSSLLGITETVIVGAGGGGNGGSGGSSGNRTSFGTTSFLSASGGGGSSGNTANTGGIGSGGDINLSGGDGQNGSLDSINTNVTGFGGTGGASFYGGGGHGATASNGQNIGGSAAEAPGSGGGGAASGAASGNAAGGSGKDGIVIITEY